MQEAHAHTQTAEPLGEALEPVEIVAGVTSTPESDHGPLPRFRIRWAENALDSNGQHEQAKRFKALARLLKKDGMEATGLDEEGFTVYTKVEKPAPKPKRKRGRFCPHCGEQL